MKKFVIFFLALLMLQSVLAVEFNVKENLDKGETFLAKLSGNFVSPVTKDNVVFYQGHVRIPADTHVTKINDEYYIYSLLTGKPSVEYLVKVENTKYYVGKEISEEDITRNFTITENTTDFSIDKGFVVTKDNFFIEVQNLQESEIGIQINANKTTPEESDKGFFASLFGTEKIQQEPTIPEDALILKSGEIKKIYFTINATQTKLHILKLSSSNSNYEIPVYAIATKTATEEQKNLSFSPSELDIIINANSITYKNITLSNNQDVSNDVSLNISESIKPYVSLSQIQVNISGKSSIELSLTISAPETEMSIEGEIIATLNTETISFPVYLTIVNESVQIPQEETSEEEVPAISKTCEENSGFVCSKTEECVGELITAKDNKCCIGECKPKEESIKGEIIGWLIVFALLGIFIWFYKYKYPKIKKNVNLLETATEFLKQSKVKKP